MGSEEQPVDRAFRLLNEARNLRNALEIAARRALRQGDQERCMRAGRLRIRAEARRKRRQRVFVALLRPEVTL